MVRKVVLAYSGGLDTSVAVRWIAQTYRCEVVCFCADIGQAEDLEGARAKALAVGAGKAIVQDLRLQFVRDYVFPALRAGTRWIATCSTPATRAVCSRIRGASPTPRCSS